MAGTYDVINKLVTTQVTTTLKLYVFCFEDAGNVDESTVKVNGYVV